MEQSEGFMATTTSIPNSTFLDAYGAGQATAAQIDTLSQNTTLANAQAVLGPLFGWGGTTQGTVAAVPLTETWTVTVGLMVERATELPDSLMSGNWATRQNALATLGSQAAVFETYGADATTNGTYNTVSGEIAGIVGAQALNDPVSLGYISTAADRTIWMTLNATEFNALFGTALLTVSSQDSAGTPSFHFAWSGDLSLPDTIAPYIDGVWFELGTTLPSPYVLNSTPTTPQAGPLGVGNSSTTPVYASPAAIAANYNFPLTSDVATSGVATPAIALVEPDVPSQAALLAAYNEYLNAVSLPDAGANQVQFMSGPTTGTGNPSGELTLDMSVVGGAAPNSTQLLYSYLTGTPFNAYQQAFFDFTNSPKVLTSSWGTFSWPTPNSPFQNAYQQLFVDGMLSNMSVHIAAGDAGSNGFLANGVANVFPANAPTYALAVGGTSIASVTAAPNDTTLTDRLSLAMINDPATVFDLVASGLRTLPTHLSTATPDTPSLVLASLFESVWQTLTLTADPDDASILEGEFGTNNAGLGGVNTGLPVPSYQSDFGLLPTSSTGTGRGVPDVSALSYGDSQYVALNSNYVTDPSKQLLTYSGGTSAATPLWASLTAQIDAVFADQHLPQLGFYNDLLYMAAAIAPASFNDTMIGTNTDSYFSTFTTETDYWNSSPVKNGPTGAGYYMQPTGDGYAAHEGYDLATGLGTPDGLVLARTLTAIAHTQTNNFANNTSYAVIDVVDDNGGATLVAQTLLVQNSYHAATVVQVDGTTAVEMGGNDLLGWTSRLAGQVVQGDNFDSALVALLDGGAKSVPYEISVLAGASLGVSAGGHELALYQELLTNDYGFIQFGDVYGGITLARPVAVAQLADIPGAPTGQDAILRIRQNGGDDAKLEIYQVDDLNGTIGGVAPGQAGYEAAAATRDYQLVGGGTVINGPGWGNFLQVEIQGVDQGDYLALKYTNATTNDVYWAFSQGNAGNATAIYSYGLNTWGFEDRPLTGDHDFQDIIVQLDFTSTSGQGLLVT